MLQVECRQSDILGRLGGEEFAILVPETPVGAAQKLASRIGDACRAVKVVTPAGDEVTCSCSIGLSQVQNDDDDIDDVLRRADAALYEAKRSGRDCWKSHQLAETT